MIILNLIALLLISVSLVSVFQNKYIRIILSIVFGLFFVMQLSSLYIGNSFIDYKYYIHFNINSLSMAGGFKMEIVLLPLLLTTVTALSIIGNMMYKWLLKKIESV